MGYDSLATTLIVRVVFTSCGRLIAISLLPLVLIGLSSWIALRSIVIPASSSFLWMSMEVTDPNALPPCPISRSKLGENFLILDATFSASASSCERRSARFAFSSSSFARFWSVASYALPCGTR